MNPEEEVSLLKHHADGFQNLDNVEDCEDDASSWKREQNSTYGCNFPFRRKILLTILLLAACILGIFSYSMSQHSAQSRSSQTVPAKLRPEKDYILDPQWDSDAEPTTREYTWIVGENVLNPDGVFRPMVLINKMFPGPLIECNEDDEIIVHVINHASNATSIHWHGLYQNGTSWMDGTVGVTQCPIAPGHSFTYRFNVTGQSGTYHYHSHMSMQASDGLWGPLIIHSRRDQARNDRTIPYTQDRVVLLSDHYYDLSPPLLMQYLAPGNENAEPVPPTALINGRNLRNCSSLPGRHCSTTGVQRALFELSANSNSRLRIINVGAFATFTLQIDEHEFYLTEVDGTDVMPEPFHRLNINPAQRYSIVLVPPQRERKDLYWMRARMITHCFAYEEPELQEEVWSVIHYNDSGEQREETVDAVAILPKSRDWPEIIEVECHDLNTSTLEPVVAMEAPGTVDHMIYLRSSFQIRDWALSRGYLNDSSFRINATSPVLDTILKNPGTLGVERSISSGINMLHFNPSTQLVYQTTGIRTIDILIQNFDDGNHPFHLHGYKFWVLAQGHGYPPPTKELHRSLNLTNPLRRDVASVEAFGWTLLRFVADNPGTWAFHCHLGWHTEAGLMMVFVTRLEEMVGQALPMEVAELCRIPGIEKGMGPNDEIWIGTWD